MTTSVPQLRTPLTQHPGGKKVGRVWLSPEQVCERVPGMTLDILTDRRKKNLAPTFYKPSHKTVIYDQAEIDAWVLSTASAPRI